MLFHRCSTMTSIVSFRHAHVEQNFRRHHILGIHHSHTYIRSVQTSCDQTPIEPLLSHTPWSRTTKSCKSWQFCTPGQLWSNVNLHYRNHNSYLRLSNPEASSLEFQNHRTPPWRQLFCHNALHLSNRKKGTKRAIAKADINWNNLPYLTKALSRIITLASSNGTK